MFDAINRKYSHSFYSKRSLSALVAATALLAISSLQSSAEEMKKSATELGKSGQAQSDGQTQASRGPSAKPKNRCMPKQPCPNSDNQQ